MKSNFVSKNWKKNWDGDWSILSCHYIGYQFTKQLEEVIGKSLKEALFISHKGLSSCYFVEEYKKEFGQYFVNQAIEDPEILLKWAKKLKETTDKILSSIEDLKKEKLSLESFNLFIEGMYDYGLYHRIIKVAVDFLPQDLLTKHLEVLEDARVYAEPVFEETELYMRHIAKEIASGTDLRPELILAMTKDQFMTYLQEGKLPESAMLEKQYQNSALYMSGGKEQFFSGKEVSDIEASLLKTNTGTTLTGQIAYKGKVKGIVRIVLDPSLVQEFNEGDILVTGMTRPDYIQIVKKSAGFITDAGGILSHAAISARELQKPCIIGTQVATKILKDGDLVELDANQGIVRRI